MAEELSQQLKYKITRAATLLAASPLDENIKNILVENLEKFTEADLDHLLIALEREASELALVGKDLKKFDEEQEKDWKSLADKQRKKANEMVEDFLKEFPVEK